MLDRLVDDSRRRHRQDGSLLTTVEGHIVQDDGGVVPAVRMGPSKAGVCALAAAFLLLVGNVPADADATLFIGALSSGTARPTVGAAVGFFHRDVRDVLGFEIEATRTLGDPPPDRQSTDTFGGSIIVQSWVARRWQIYGLAGGTLFTESGEGATHLGGGVKFAVVSRLRARVDYRVYLPGDNENPTLGIVGHPTRLTAGLALAF